MKVTLSEIELATIHILSNIRTITARNNKIKDMKMTNSNGADIDRDGMIGEYAFCKLHNLFLEITASPRSGSYDCMWKGKRIDIKTTRHQSGRLLATLKQNPDVDVYVLAILDGATVDFRGWCYYDELKQECNKIDLGYGEGYALTQDKLRKFDV